MTSKPQASRPVPGHAVPRPGVGAVDFLVAGFVLFRVCFESVSRGGG